MVKFTLCVKCCFSLTVESVNKGKMQVLNKCLNWTEKWTEFTFSLSHFLCAVKQISSATHTHLLPLFINNHKYTDTHPLSCTHALLSHMCSEVHIFMWVVSFSDSLGWGITDGCENLRPCSKACLSGGITALCCAGGQLESFSSDILICISQECDSRWSGHQKRREGGRGGKGSQRIQVISDVHRQVNQGEKTCLGTASPHSSYLF